MGVYLFRTDFLLELLARVRCTVRPTRDLARDVLPDALQEGCVIAHRYTDREGRPAAANAAAHAD
jgi:ADP-glucose pyrophosphorylase